MIERVGAGISRRSLNFENYSRVSISISRLPPIQSSSGLKYFMGFDHSEQLFHISRTDPYRSNTNFFCLFFSLPRPVSASAGAAACRGRQVLRESVPTAARAAGCRDCSCGPTCRHRAAGGVRFSV